MPSSPLFARIKAQVLQLTAAIPAGKLCSHASIGEHLDVVPRHVAYILSQLDDGEKQRVPWHRVVGADLRLGTLKRHPDGRTQAELLREEGLLVSGDRVAMPPERVLLPAEALPSGLARQQRPADAPVAAPGPARRARAR